MKKLEIKINLSLAVIEENGKFIAYSSALDLSTSGKSVAQAKKNFAEAVDLFFEEIARHNIKAKA